MGSSPSIVRSDLFWIINCSVLRVQDTFIVSEAVRFSLSLNVQPPGFHSYTKVEKGKYIAMHYIVLHFRNHRDRSSALSTILFNTYIFIVFHFISLSE